MITPIHQPIPEYRRGKSRIAPHQEMLLLRDNWGMSRRLVKSGSTGWKSMETPKMRRICQETLGSARHCVHERLLSGTIGEDSIFMHIHSIFHVVLQYRYGNTSLCETTVPVMANGDKGGRSASSS